MMMLWFLFSSALGATCPSTFDARVSELLEEGTRDRYVCVVDAEDAERQLVSFMGEGWEDSAPVLRRALVFVLLNTLQRPWNPQHVLRLSPADRRLLADGVKARRGRKSPAADHDAIFQQWPWYQPVPSYTDGRLSQIDRINIGMADNPKEFIPTKSLTTPTSSGCGCGTVTPMGWMGLGPLLVCIGMRRRSGV